VPSAELTNMLNQLRDLIHYQEWADSQFFSQWYQTNDAHNQEELRRRAGHIVMVQKLFLDLLENQEAVFPDKNAPLPEINYLRDRSKQIHERWKNALSSLPENRLQDLIKVPFFGNPDFAIRLEEAIIQVLLHTQHHRGQNMELLHRIGSKTPIVDWILWILKGKPAAEW
jgi:uncharacterized damage-inducible protein DinB